MVRTLRRFNSQGLKEFEICHANLKERRPDQMGALLENDDLTENVLDVEMGEIRPFRDRMAAAKRMDDLISGLYTDTYTMRSDAGLWTWLTWCWWDTLVENGRIRDLACYMPEIGNFRKYYRHYLGGAWDVYNIHRDDPDRAIILLCQPVNAPGDIVEGITARQEIVTNKPVVQVFTNLYFDFNKRKIKKYAASKSQEPGSARRLVDVLKQLDQTYALNSMSPEAIMDLLPDEFDRFK